MVAIPTGYHMSMFTLEKQTYNRWKQQKHNNNKEFGKTKTKSQQGNKIFKNWGIKGELRSIHTQ